MPHPVGGVKYGVRLSKTTTSAPFASGPMASSKRWYHPDELLGVRYASPWKVIPAMLLVQVTESNVNEMP